MARKKPRRTPEDEPSEAQQAEDGELSGDDPVTDEASTDEATSSTPEAESSAHVREVLRSAGVPDADLNHPRGPTLAHAWELYLLGDYNAARDAASPLEQRGDVPESYRRAVDSLRSVMGIETVSLAIGAALVVLFLIVLSLLY